VALVPAWLAARDVSLAIANWRTNTPLTYARLSNAARMNPLSDEPYVVAGTIAERHRDWTAARRYFVRAVGRDATNWYSQLELGIAQARLGDRRAALLSARKASTLDPREPLVSDVVAALRAGRPISVSGLDRLMVDRTTVLTAR
jgi:Flp pilus assembly protein TadD